MSNTPDPNEDANFDFENLEGDADPFAGEAPSGADPFDFSAEAPAAPPPPPAAPSASGKSRKSSKKAPPPPPAAPGPVAKGGRSASTAGLAADVAVQVVAVLGKKSVTVGDLVSLKKGEVVELNRFPNEAVDLVANGKLMAKGELVEIDGKLGVRIIKICE